MNSGKISNDQIITEKLLNLSASLFPKIYLFEWALKKNLYTAITQQLGEHWLSQQIENEEKTSYLKEEISFIAKRKKKGYKLTDESFVAESALGFWVELFNKEAYKQYKGAPIKIFKRLPPTIKRKDIYQIITRIKDFRNQLFHGRIPFAGPQDREAFLKRYYEANKDLELFFKWLDISEYKGIIEADSSHQVQELISLISINHPTSP